MDDDDFRKLLDHFDLSFRGYRKVRGGVKKRLVRHLQELGCKNISEYLTAAAADAVISEAVRQRLTVSISRFFRDKRLWEVLAEQVLPEITANRPGLLKVWSAGCARGEEAYSFKIVYQELRGRIPDAPDLEILATDLNPLYLEMGRKGIFNAGNLKEVPERIKAVYFTTGPDGTRTVADSLKAGLTWAEHDLLSGTSPGIFDFIFLRNNVLTYCGEALQARAVALVEESLAPEGFLVIGSHEKLPASGSGFMQDDHHLCLYRRIAAMGQP